MESVQENEAQSFLTKNGLKNYVEELVVKNKFETISDLKLLTNLESDNMFKHLGLPLCMILKLRSELQKLHSTSDDLKIEEPMACDGTAVVPHETSVVPHNYEIPKMKLLELQKNSVEAQYANAQCNKFTSFLASKVKEFYQEGK
ncbi:Hypothetical predicted protein, partial [Paramuricea clavata]